MLSISSFISFNFFNKLFYSLLKLSCNFSSWGTNSHAYLSAGSSSWRFILLWGLQFLLFSSSSATMLVLRKYWWPRAVELCFGIVCVYFWGVKCLLFIIDLVVFIVVKITSIIFTILTIFSVRHTVLTTCTLLYSRSLKLFSSCMTGILYWLSNNPLFLLPLPLTTTTQLSFLRVWPL